MSEWISSGCPCLVETRCGHVARRSPFFLTEGLVIEGEQGPAPSLRLAASEQQVRAIAARPAGCGNRRGVSCSLLAVL